MKSKSSNEPVHNPSLTDIVIVSDLSWLGSLPRFNYDNRNRKHGCPIPVKDCWYCAAVTGGTDLNRPSVEWAHEAE